MPFGSKDALDRLLVQKYAQKQANKAPVQEEPKDIDPDTIMLAMNDYSLAGKCMFAINKKIMATCYCINAANATYEKRIPSKYVEYIILLSLIVLI